MFSFKIEFLAYSWAASCLSDELILYPPPIAAGLLPMDQDCDLKHLSRISNNEPTKPIWNMLENKQDARFCPLELEGKASWKNTIILELPTDTTVLGEFILDPSHCHDHFEQNISVDFDVLLTESLVIVPI